MWAFAYGDPLAATAFSFLGAFFGWWALAQMTFLGVHAASAVTMNSMALVFIVSGVVTLYVWVASFYEFAAFNLVLLFLWIAFILVGIGELTGVRALDLLGGIGALISGLIAAYGSFAAIYNESSLNEVVPLGESKRRESASSTRKWSGCAGCIRPATPHTPRCAPDRCRAGARALFAVTSQMRSETPGMNSGSIA